MSRRPHRYRRRSQASFPADEAGFAELFGWLVGFGAVLRVGVEGMGSWGVGLARILAEAEVGGYAVAVVQWRA